MIRIELEQTQVRAGEQLRGRVIWTLDGGKPPRNVEVLCRWRIEGKASSEEVVDRLVESDIGSRQELTLPLNFSIPFLGPLTYQGTLFQIVWEIVARADLAMARDEVETQSFVVIARAWSPEEYEESDEEEEEEDGGEDGEGTEEESLQ